jgi:hypothetical protein
MDEPHEKIHQKVLAMNAYLWLAGFFNVLPLPNNSSELRLNSLKKEVDFLVNSSFSSNLK